MSAFPLPEFEMQEEKQPAIHAEGVECTSCGSQISATSQMCLNCGMPVPQADEKPVWRIATPAPELMPAPKPYDPYAQFYTATMDEPHTIPPEPQFDAPAFGIRVNSAAEAENRKWASENIRAAVAVLAIVVVVLAAVFGLMVAWRSRTQIAANFEEVRTRLHEMSASRTDPWPRYTVTPISKFDRARRVAAAASATTSVVASNAPEISLAAVGSGPGTLHVQISPAPPAPNVIPVSIGNAGSVVPASRPTP